MRCPAQCSIKEVLGTAQRVHYTPLSSHSRAVVRKVSSLHIGLLPFTTKECDYTDKKKKREDCSAITTMTLTAARKRSEKKMRCCRQECLPSWHEEEEDEKRSAAVSSDLIGLLQYVKTFHEGRRRRSKRKKKKCTVSHLTVCCSESFLFGVTVPMVYDNPVSTFQSADLSLHQMMN